MTIPFLFTLAFAIYEAFKDQHDIKLGIPIDHTRGWIARMVTVCVVIAFTILFTNAPWLSGIPCAIGCGFLFSAVFRFALNRWRGLHWNYISPSSSYDWMFLRPFMHPIDRTECVEAWHVYMASMSALRAGLIAYIFELAIAASCSYIVL